MKDSNEIVRSVLALQLEFKDLSQQYFHLSIKSSLSTDELDLIDSILERCEDSKVLSDMIASCDRELHERTLLSDSSIVESLRDQTCQILQSINDISINKVTSQLADTPLARLNREPSSELKFIYNLGFYFSGVDILFNSKNLDGFDFSKQKVERFDSINFDSINAKFFADNKENNFDSVDYSDVQRNQFINQIVDLYSPNNQYTHLIREYFYISSCAIVSEAQASRVEDILEQSQFDPILRSFIGEVDRWILEDANLMSSEMCEEYESQKLELKAFVQSHQAALEDAIVYQSSYLPTVQENKILVQPTPFYSRLECRFFQTFGIGLRARMVKFFSNPRLLSAVFLTTMVGAFVSILFLNPKYLSVFLSNDSSLGQESTVPSSFGNLHPLGVQEHSDPDNISSLQSEGSWKKSPTLPATLTSSNSDFVYALISALEKGQSSSENSQQSSEWSQKSAEARQLMAESYQKLAETQQLLASAKQSRAEDQHQKAEADLWLAEAQKWGDLSARWANQSLVEQSQAQEYLRASQRELSRAQKYLSATNSVRAEGIQVSSLRRETALSSSPKLSPLDRRDSPLASFHSALFTIQLALITVSGIGLGILVGIRQSQRTAG